MSATPKTSKPTAAEPTVTPSEPNLEVVSQRAPRERGHLNVYGGRGGTGKSTHVKWLTEDGLRAGRAVFPADGDRFNQTTRAYFPEALHPGGADAEQVGPWLLSTADWAALDRVESQAKQHEGDDDDDQDAHVGVSAAADRKFQRRLRSRSPEPISQP